MRRGVNGEFSNDIFNLQRGEECEVLDFSDIREEGVLKFVIGSKEVIKLKDWMKNGRDDGQMIFKVVKLVYGEGGVPDDWVGPIYKWDSDCAVCEKSCEEAEW